GRAERAWCWCRRNPLVAFLAGAGATVLFTVIVVGTSGHIPATRGPALAGEQRQAAGDKAAPAAAQPQLAEANLKVALAAVDRFFTQVSENPKLKTRDLEDLRRELLKTAQEFYEKFVAERGADPNLQAELGRAYSRLAAVQWSLVASA